MRQAASSTSSAAARLSPAPFRSACLAARTATGEFAAIWLASCIALVLSWPAGTSRSARPIAAASPAPTLRPEKIRSAARPGPILRASNWVPPQPGTSPTLASGSPSCAVASTAITSQLSASSQPPPSAYPCTAAITGCGSASSAPNAARNTGRCAMICASLIAARSLRSAPTQNARSPAADSTTAVIPGVRRDGREVRG